MKAESIQTTNEPIWMNSMKIESIPWSFCARVNRFKMNRFRLLVMTFWTDSNLQKWIQNFRFVWIDSNSQLWHLNQFKYTKTILDDLRKAHNTNKQTKECFMHARSLSGRSKGVLNLERQITHDLKLS